MGDSAILNQALQIEDTSNQETNLLIAIQREPLAPKIRLFLSPKEPSDQK